MTLGGAYDTYGCMFFLWQFFLLCVACGNTRPPRRDVASLTSETFLRMKKIEVEWVYVRAEDAFGDHHHHHHQQQQQQLASCGRHNEQSSDTGDSGGFYVRVLSHSRPAANRSSGLYTLTSLSRSLQCTETLLFSFFHVFAHVAPVTSSLLFFFLRTE